MHSTYAVLGLGLSSRDYFPLVQRYMLLVDTEHQSVQDPYAETFHEAHSLSVEIMPVFVAILLGASESAKPLKNIDIRELDLLVALRQELRRKKIISVHLHYTEYSVVPKSLLSDESRISTHKG